MKNEIMYSVVVPLFNEQLVIEESYKRLKKTMDKTNESYEIIFVNDGSIDKTRYLAEDICKNDRNIKLLNFSRNFGHQAAITAGMRESLGSAVIVIDADLQDPPEVILEMIKKWKLGYDVVYGMRSKRKGETFFKKFTSAVFYRFLRSIISINIPLDTGDFRLIDRKVCDALNSLPEKNRYVRGLASWVGFRQTCVEFVRQERFAGKTKYSLKKIFKLASDGITSFSYKPLTIAGYFGGVMFAGGFISFIYSLLKSVFRGTKLLSLGLVLSINFIMFGCIMIFCGILGQYIGRIYDESRNRPMYIIESKINSKNTLRINKNIKFDDYMIQR